MEAKSVIDIFTILVYKQIMNASSTGPSVARSVGFATMTGSLMAATRALYCCADAHVADAAVRGSGEENTGLHPIVFNQLLE